MELRFAASRRLQRCDFLWQKLSRCPFQARLRQRRRQHLKLLPRLSGQSFQKEIYIVETKGQEDLDVPLKMQRLRQWCEDINRVQNDVHYDFVFVDEESLIDTGQVHL